MSKKKNRNRNETVLQTLSRLATTVKADAPTVVLKDSGAKHAPGADAPRAPSRFSRLAAKLNPFSQRDKKLKKLAKQMAGGHAMTARRSRLPIVIALLVAMIGGGSYWLYQQISFPDIKLTQYLDHKKWLDLVSGKADPKSRQPKARVVKVATKKPQAVAQSTSKSQAVKSGKATKAGKATKVAKKPSKKQQEKLWKERLAKLQKQSEKKYRKASHKYRKRQ